MSSQTLRRHIGKLEKTFGGERCIWREQAYWTDQATNKALGPYSEMAYGNQAGLVVVQELSALLGQDQDNRHLEHLPRYRLDAEHREVIEAYRRVEESRPPRRGCPCFAAWTRIRDVEAAVLYHYPAVADRLIEDLTEYAASPPEKPLYHFIGECACL